MWKPANSHMPAGSGHLGTYCEWPRRCQASFFRNAAHAIARLRPIRTNMKLLGSGTVLVPGVMVSPDTICISWLSPPEIKAKTAKGSILTR